MTAPLNNAKLGFLMPVVLNPATAAVVGIGLGLLWLLRYDEKDAPADAVPIDLLTPAVLTVAEPLPAVKNLPMKVEIVATGAAHTAISKPDQKEMILNAVSELGRRSAAARAKKKAERENEIG